MIRSTGRRRFSKSDQHPAKHVMLMMSEFRGGFARVGEHHGHGTLIGNAHLDRMIAIDQSRHHADGGRDPMRGKQPA